MNEYSRKMLKVPTYNLLREQDMGKLPVLDVRNLGIDFGGLTAVDSFNITIGPTEISGLIGPNGAGKTTIFNLLTGVYQPTRGSVLINGIDIKGMPIHKVNRLGIARTFQNIRLFGRSPSNQRKAFAICFGKWLKNNSKDKKTNVIVYSAYFPFLIPLRCLKKKYDLKVSLIITDLPFLCKVLENYLKIF